MNSCRDDDGVCIHPERVHPDNPCRHLGEAPRAAASFNQALQRMATLPLSLAVQASRGGVSGELNRSATRPHA